ncbi:MAG: MBL fold metallo-hydrolase [Bacteroidetes bacterium]|nr:MBL fold metallo-hydrolase [Bacteroidota bacterium]MCL1968602.1 MBL fold metallo-hydrolase [Bacteroidota bacterium]
MKLQCIGASGNEVTGSKFLLTTNENRKILIDCGMYQGKGLATDAMNRDLGFEPSEVDFILLSHAHIDHSGLIPYIYKKGFKGKIFCTPATRDLCAIMLPDSGKIQETDTAQFNKKRALQKLPPVEPLYTMQDAAACMGHFISIPYNLTFSLTPAFSFEFYDSGHILGGASIYISFVEAGKTKTLLYTGDVGRYNKRILLDPCLLPQADYIMCESTYGNRLHDSIEDAEQKLMLVVLDACAKRRGKLIIPAFAIGRAQEIVYALHRLKKAENLPGIRIFVDSPLAVSATNIFRLHSEQFNEEMQQFILLNPDPFGFDNLHYIRTIDDSKRLNTYNQPCIIISASGMMEAGRVKHHLANNIDNPRTTILSVGYCAPTTLGAKIMRGDKEVSIFGVKYKVRAHLESLQSYSGHADYNELLRYLDTQNPELVKKLFIIHGEDDARAAFADKLVNAGFGNVAMPKFKEEYEV